jgi:hypothetical protein
VNSRDASIYIISAENWLSVEREFALYSEGFYQLKQDNYTKLAKYLLASCIEPTG